MFYPTSLAVLLLFLGLLFILFVFYPASLTVVSVCYRAGVTILLGLQGTCVVLRVLSVPIPVLVFCCLCLILTMFLLVICISMCRLIEPSLPKEQGCVVRVAYRSLFVVVGCGLRLKYIGVLLLSSPNSSSR